jgi:hypothetical protein
VPKSAKPPACADCNGPHARYVPDGDGHVWLCADCEYERRHPGRASGVVAVPWEQQPAPLQRERLF